MQDKDGACAGASCRQGQDEREERDKEKENRKNEKAALVEKCEPKKRGRPRKVDEPPEVEESNPKKRKDEKQVETGRKQKEEDGDEPKAKGKAKKKVLEDTEDPHEQGGEKPKAKGKAKKNKVPEDMEDPAEEPPAAVPKKKAYSKKAARKKAETPEEAQEIEDEDMPDPKARRRRIRRLTEDVQEMDESLARECQELMRDEGDNPEVDRDEIRHVLFGNFMTNPCIKVVFYWDRNAVGLKVKAEDGTFPQCFYFQVKGCPTIKVATILAKRMFDKIGMRGHEWAHTEGATAFEQVLKNSASYARAERER